jgi:hypothetical protein
MGISEDALAALQANLSRDAKRKRDRGPREDTAHRAVAKYLDADPRFARRWFHPANGEARDAVTGAKLKGMGVKRGAPDIWIIAPLTYEGRPCPGVVIELKRERGGKTTPEQDHWLEVARAAGFVTRVCHGASDAIDTIRELYSCQ